MKSVLAVLLSALLCLQNVSLSSCFSLDKVYAMPAKDYIVCEDTKDSQGTAPQENKSDSKEARDSQAALSEAAAEEQDTADSGPKVSAPSAILMEASTGDIIYEKDANTKRPPASVTKVMTLLLIFDALADGKIKLDDQVTTSELAASMGGSQVFLEPGETQTVDTMLKCISIASANDACVAY